MCGTASPFRYFFTDITCIRMRDPLAEAFGALREHDALLEFSFDDAAKMTGAVTPLTAASFVCCRILLAKLYQGSIPRRGSLSVHITAGREQTEAGSAGLIFSYITGANIELGYPGIEGKLSRSGLLAITRSNEPGTHLKISMTRNDSGGAVSAVIQPDRFPMTCDRKTLENQLKHIASGTAEHEELHSFQDLWMEQIKAIALKEQGIGDWLDLTGA